MSSYLSKRAIMKTSDFSFSLPSSLIAQYPAEKREASRLLLLDRKTGNIAHSCIDRIKECFEPGSVLIFNNSRVRKARLYGTRVDTGGLVEFLLLKSLSGQKWDAMVNKSKKHRVGNIYSFPGGMEAVITESSGSTKTLEFSAAIGDKYLEEYGHMPLPPYIKREDESIDTERYQTVFSKAIGSVAAPTAGLHFSNEVLDGLRERGVQILFVTLHVGIGTFLPVRTENVEDHTMHSESFTVPEETALAIETAKSRGTPVTAVGTTSVRTLESAWTPEGIRRGRNATNLFIYPGYKFKVVDRLITNFHVPESSLLMMVAAFAGTNMIKNTYAVAVEQKYRFFSYGDVMFIR
jgi:S-adenosylmethionine:tRNA ribosyltransferase-isomerase